MPYAPLTVPFVENQKEHLTNNTNHFKTTIETPKQLQNHVPQAIGGRWQRQKGHRNNH